MYCKNCQKQVVIMGIGHGATEEEIESVRHSVEQEEKLVLFNPPPWEPYRCPDCGAELDIDSA